MKILTTQITGLFQRIAAKNEEAVEETARLLAQALVGEGRVVIAAFDEMAAVASNAILGAEPLERAVTFSNELELTRADRVWILARTSDDQRALRLAETLTESGIPFAALAAEAMADGNKLAELATTYLATGITKGLLPGPDGNRIVEPHAMAALFLYEAVKLELDEMLAD